ncbi:MAG: hypothetical protein DRP30_01635 [Thermotoga sp.]|nr:MAG: hypothetical protein DRP30_01635 [Thermotoga sp.]
MGIGKPVLVGRKVIAIEKMGLVLDEEYVRRAVVISAHNALKFGKSVDLKTLKFEGSPMEVFGIGEYEALGIVSKMGEIRRIEDCLKEWCS